MKGGDIKMANEPKSMHNNHGGSSQNTSQSSGNRNTSDDLTQEAKSNGEQINPDDFEKGSEEARDHGNI